MQAQWFLIDHCIKKSEQIISLSQFLTRKLLAQQHHMALDITTMDFILKEKLHCYAKIPLL
jgi:hypothetical protein